MRLALALAVSLGGCTAAEDPGPPCEDDINGCSASTTTLVPDPECTLTGELELQLGEGQLEFMPLGEGQLPALETGIQGGQHVWMAVRVLNPDLERMQLAIVIDASYCEADCERDESWVIDNHRELLADETTLTVTEAGAYEQIRMLVTLFDWIDADRKRIEVWVTDPCGRQGYGLIATEPRD